LITDRIQPDREARMSTRHQKSRSGGPFTGDLERNPGIGQSRGAFATAADLQELEGENTVEGDVENDANAQGGIDEHQRARTNE
jgi:hypothetical protein